MSRKLMFVALFGLALGISPKVMAIAIPATDLDVAILTAGAVVAPSISSSFMTIDATSIGTLDGEVRFNGSVYTYILTVTPSINNISEFNTGFRVLGFTGTAGWSFSDVAAAGATGVLPPQTPATAFELQFDAGDGSLDWEARYQDLALSSGWDSGESIRFFFQTTLPPGSGKYNLINEEVGRGSSYAPVVPEPATLLLAGSGLIALGALRRRKSA